VGAADTLGSPGAGLLINIFYIKTVAGFGRQALIYKFLRLEGVAKYSRHAFPLLPVVVVVAVDLIGYSPFTK
jgi:hypothetical protein